MLRTAEAKHKPSLIHVEDVVGQNLVFYDHLLKPIKPFSNALLVCAPDSSIFQAS